MTWDTDMTIKHLKKFLLLPSSQKKQHDKEQSKLWECQSSIANSCYKSSQLRLCYVFTKKVNINGDNLTLVVSTRGLSPYPWFSGDSSKDGVRDEKEMNMNFSRTKNKNLLLSESKFNLTIRLYIAGFASWSRTGSSIHKLQPCSSKDWPGTQ